MRKQVFCLMGPTASGKTALACELVQRLPFEIISIDSGMIYRDMNIGSAKPDKATLAKAPHHLIDILDPIDSYSAAQCCDDVMALCDEIVARGHIPLLVGGTMMYFRALQEGLSTLPKADESLRQALLAEANEHGWLYMHEYLKRIDPASANRIHPADTQRIQRAIEVFRLSGKPLSSLLVEKVVEKDIEFINLILMPADRAWLHQRIFQRFQLMLTQGFVDEVRELRRKWPLSLAMPAMRCVGYRQVFEYLDGKFDEVTLVEKGVAATRQLAKRQLTWLRHWSNGHYFIAENATNLQEMLAFIQQTLDNAQ